MVDTLVPNNPYVGPRALKSGEAFYGRDKEIRSISALLISERIALVHSPSGAGKSSLIQAGLAPHLADRFNVLPVVRVNLEPPEELRDLQGANRYLLSTLISLDEGLPAAERTPLRQLATLTVDAYLNQRPRPASETSNDLLIFDQFEEVLTTSLTDGSAKQQFFEQLGEALQDRRRWALFAIREDYMGGLAPYVRTIPNRLSVTFRLGLLGPEAAKLAIQKPAKDKEVDFTDEAAVKLVDDLRLIQVQQPDGSFVPEAGPSIEPVQLQVVCFNLWQSHAADDKVIDTNDLQRVGSVDQALASYYANAAHLVAETAGVDERLLRRWFDENLITPEGIRSQVLKGAESTEGLSNIAIRLLENTHLVRGETRAGKTWYELSHDRLVAPVRKDNASWFKEHLSLLQSQSVLWNQQGRGEGLLLRGKELEAAESQAAAGQLTSDEQDFLQACLSLRKREQQEQRQKRVILAALVVSLIFLALAVLGFIQAGRQTQAAQVAKDDALAQKAIAVTNADAASSNANRAGTAEAGALAEANRAVTAEAGALANAHAASTAQAEAVQNSDRAASAQATAESALKQVLTAAGYRAQALADASRLQRRDGNITLSTLLAIEAFKIVDNYQTRGNLFEIVKDTVHIPNVDGSNHSGSALMIDALSFSPDGSRMAAGYRDGTIVLWATNPLRYFSVLGLGSTPPVAGLAYSPDGKVVYKAEYDNKSISIWDALTQDRVSNPIQPPKVTDHRDDILSLALSPDGKYLATGSQDETIRLWDAASLERIGQPLNANAGWVESVDFSPDGKFLASAHRDGSIRLWDLTTGLQVGEPLTGHKEDIYKVKFSPDGKLLASGGQDRRVILWDVEKHAMIGQPLTGHQGAVDSVAFSPDGRILVSGSNDGSLILWDVETRRMIGQIIPDPPNPINNVVFDPSGKVLASGSKDGTISLWNLDGQAWIEAACRKAGRNLKPAEWDQYFRGEAPRKTCPQW